jgi:hypothetical protein
MIEKLRPLANLSTLGFIVGITGIVLTVATFLASRHEAAISYHTATIQIVDQKEAVPFSVIDSDGQHVTQNVYATNVTVWNSGDLPIDPQNIRSPLTISLTTPVRIIDAKLDYTTSANISEFSMSGDPKKTGTVVMAWRSFDPKEGFRVRLIYASNEMSQVKLNGVIFGINGFADITVPHRGEGRKIYQAPAFWQMAASLIWLILTPALLVLAQRRRRTGSSKDTGADAASGARGAGKQANPGPGAGQGDRAERARRQLRVAAGLCLGAAMALELWGAFKTMYPPSSPF